MPSSAARTIYFLEPFLAADPGAQPVADQAEQDQQAGQHDVGDGDRPVAARSDAAAFDDEQEVRAASPPRAAVVNPTGVRKNAAAMLSIRKSSYGLARGSQVRRT